MKNSFFAMMFRMKYIKRWSLMRSNLNENLSEHSLETVIIAHALATIGNNRFGKKYNCDKIAVKALYHDAPEILTGDMPTPVKYYNKQMREAYETVETAAKNNFVAMLPSELKHSYQEIFKLDNDEKEIIKTADKICALIKCKIELNSGNIEFEAAYKTILTAIQKMNSPEAEYFLENFLNSFSLPIDLL